MDKKLKMVLFKDGSIISHPRYIDHNEMLIFRGKMIGTSKFYNIIIRNSGVFINLDVIPLHLIDEKIIKPNVFERNIFLNHKHYTLNERVSWVSIVCDRDEGGSWDIKVKNGAPSWFLRQYNWYMFLIRGELKRISKSGRGSIPFEWISWKEFRGGRHREILG